MAQTTDLLLLSHTRL